MKSQISDIIINSAYAGLKLQNNIGAMPCGFNGPYNDPETPVRNTSHYLMAFLRAWELSNDGKFLNGAEKCLNYLLKDNPYRHKHTFHHRSKNGKDSCNGLIGPAWNIEALLFASTIMKNQDAYNLASELFLLHPFDYEKGLWHRVEPDGRVLSIDSTFNHQLWFAASVAQAGKENDEINKRINRFIEKLSDNLNTAQNGRIIHSLLTDRKTKLRERIKRIIKPRYRKEIVLKEIGYHTFNLYAFAMLIEVGYRFSDDVYKKLKKSVNYMLSKEFKKLIYLTKYSFSYNPPGWEIPYIISVFKPEATNESHYWINQQLKHSYDSKDKSMSLNTADLHTHNARIYECVRWPDSYFKIEMDKISIPTN